MAVDEQWWADRGMLSPAARKAQLAPDPKPGQDIAVWVSCGAASAVAAVETVVRYGNEHNVRLLNNPIAEEDEDNQRFIDDLSAILGRPIERVLSRQYPSQSCEDVWETRKYMSGPGGAPCTMILKKWARQEWEKENHVDWHVFGFTLDEKARHENFVRTERSNVLPVLIDLELTKADCFRRIQEWGLELPRVYSWGYPNANCIGCVKASSATYWNHVRTQNPDVFDKRSEMSRRLGVKLAYHKGKRVFLDELPEDARGRPMKSMDVECGIFCEEKG